MKPREWLMWQKKMKNNIKELRKSRKLRQEDLAEKLGVTRQTVIAIENDKYDPTLELAMKISVFFGLTVNDIFHLNCWVWPMSAHTFLYSKSTIIKEAGWIRSLFSLGSSDKKRIVVFFYTTILLVEMGRVELPSESTLTGTSPGADGTLHSLILPHAVMLKDLVASWFMICAKLSIFTFTTRRCPIPGRGPPGRDTHCLGSEKNSVIVVL